MMWLIIFAVLLIAAVGGFVYLTAGFHRFSLLKRLGERHKLLSWGISALITAVIAALGLLINVWSSIVIMIHLFIFWAIADLIAAVVRRIAKKKRTRNWSGVCAIAFTAIYLAFGWYAAHQVVRTEYDFTTDRQLDGGNLRVAMIADAHLGITLDGDEFAAQMERISDDEPDVVVIAGDFVDDDSRRDDMARACAALGEMKPKYGVYFAFGNHDKGYYQSMRDFSEADLRSELTKNGVVILEDESVMLGEYVVLTGRQDKSVADRKPYGDIDRGTGDLYRIVIDHQPNDYAAEEENGANLVLSGHTHGGHLFPAGYIGLWIGANDFVYGAIQQSRTNFVVTSGISGWALPFKTGTKSEYVIIDVVEE